MEPRIVNRYTQNRTVIREFFKETFYGSLAMKLCDVLIAVAMIYCILQIVLLHIPNTTIYALPMLLLLQYAFYRKTASSTYDRTVAANGGSEQILTTEITEEEIRVSNEKGPIMTFAWNEIKTLVLTKKLCLLQAAGGQSVVLTRDGFTKGTAEELRDMALSAGRKIRGKI